MAKQGANRLLPAAYLALLFGCGSEGPAVDGSLFLSTHAPPWATSVEFTVACEADGGTDDGTPDAEGELETAGSDPETGHSLWLGLVPHLPPGDCTVRLVAVDAICSAMDSVSIAAGEVVEQTIFLICAG